MADVDIIKVMEHEKEYTVEELQKETKISYNNTVKALSRLIASKFVIVREEIVPGRSAPLKHYKLNPQHNDLRLTLKDLKNQDYSPDILNLDAVALINIVQHMKNIEKLFSDFNKEMRERK